jgi:hypothetical protein
MGTAALSGVRRRALELLLALVLTALTAFYQRLGNEPVRYEGVEPGWSYTRVIVGGWPLPFIYDKPYFSPANSVDWFGVLLRLDEFRPLSFLGDTAIYWVLLWTVQRCMPRRSS